MQKDIADATRADVIAFVSRESLSDSSKGIYLVQLRTFYRWAIDDDLLVADPTAKIKGPRGRRRLPRPMEPDDFSAALMTARPRLRTWLLLGGFAGLRCCDMAGLQIELLHLDVPEPYMEVEGKGGHFDAVPLHPVLVDVLRRQTAGRSGWVFPHQYDDRRHVLANSISSAINDHLRELGILRTAHSTRHLFGTTVYRESGYDIRVAQELLRHGSITSTQIYTKVESPRRYEVVGRLAYGVPEQRS